LFVVVVVEHESPLDRISLGLGDSDGGGVGHRRDRSGWQHQGRHVHVAHQPRKASIHRSIHNTVFSFFLRRGQEEGGLGSANTFQVVEAETHKASSSSSSSVSGFD